MKRPAVGPPIPNSKFIRPVISPSAAASHSASHPHSAAVSHPHSAAVSHPHSTAVSHPHSVAVSHPYSAGVSLTHPSTPVKKVQVIISLDSSKDEDASRIILNCFSHKKGMITLKNWHGLSIFLFLHITLVISSLIFLS